MTSGINSNYCVNGSRTFTDPSGVPKDKVDRLVGMYDEAIDRSKSECRMWSDIQRETAQAITARFKGGQINDKTAMVLHLLNDAMAHRTYARCESDIQMAEYRMEMLKSHLPEYFEKKKAI